MTHLNPARIEQLLDGSIDPLVAQALAAHLSEDCEICAASLTHEPDLDTLVRLLDAVTAEPAIPPLPVGVAIWKQIDDKLDAPVAKKAAQGQRRKRWFIVAAVAAVAACVALVPVLLPSTNNGDNPGWDGKKGGVPAPMVDLKVLIGNATETGFIPGRRLGQGDMVTPGDTLVFELKVSADAARYVVVMNGDGEPYWLYPQPGTAATIQPAGQDYLKSGDEWIAFQVDPDSGPLTLIAGASLEVLDSPSQILTLLQNRAPHKTVGLQALSVQVAN
jgi:hypothetical protein